MLPKANSKLNILLACLACFVLLLVGLWYLARPAALETSRSAPAPESKPDPSSPQSASIKALKTLPYVAWAPIDESETEKVGVTKYDPSLSYKGPNIFCAENMYGGALLDMSGKPLHTFFDKSRSRIPWKLIEPYRNDDFLVLVEDRALLLIDWDSNIKWIRRMRFHHDVAFAENGDIYTILNKKAVFPQFSLQEPILDNCLVVLTETGQVKKEISFAEMISHHQVLLAMARNQVPKRYHYGREAWDIFHTNTVEVIDQDVFSNGKKLFKKGDVLFCIRHLNIVGVMDPNLEKIVWFWGIGQLDLPHHPSLLENGNLLIFDNGTHRKYSRIMELNPVTERIEWEYKADPPTSFYSLDRGSAQRLPNGNTLISQSNKGRVFEVTRDGQIVWEYFGPQNKEKYLRACIYRMTRITDLQKYPRLELPR